VAFSADGCIDEGGKPPFVPMCEDEELTFITPAQYKERMGREWTLPRLVDTIKRLSLS